MTAHRLLRRYLIQRITPPLQPHLGKHLLLGNPRRAGHLQVKGKQRKQYLPGLNGSCHYCQEPRGITTLDERRTGIEVG